MGILHVNGSGGGGGGDSTTLVVVAAEAGEREGKRGNLRGPRGYPLTPRSYLYGAGSCGAERRHGLAWADRAAQQAEGDPRGPARAHAVVGVVEQPRGAEERACPHPTPAARSFIARPCASSIENR